MITPDSQLNWEPSINHSKRRNFITFWRVLGFRYLKVSAVEYWFLFSATDRVSMDTDITYNYISILGEFP